MCNRIEDLIEKARHFEDLWHEALDDNAMLKEEAERYRLASLRVDVDELHTQFNRALFDETVAENARLKSLCDNLGMGGKHTITAIEAENARLKAEVESLYRHGDLMLKFAAANMTFPAYATMAKDWNAAKEGKQP